MEVEQPRLTRDLIRATGITGDEAISAYKKASIRREFPGGFLQKTIQEIEQSARSGDREARTALNLLFQREYDK